MKSYYLSCPSNSREASPRKCPHRNRSDNYPTGTDYTGFRHQSSHQPEAADTSIFAADKSNPVRSIHTRNADRIRLCSFRGLFVFILHFFFMKLPPFLEVWCQMHQIHAAVISVYVLFQHDRKCPASDIPQFLMP